MTTTDIKNRIDALTKERFYLACKDRWLQRDFDQDWQLYKEITELEKMLKERE
jgi:hypothetical protein